MSQTQTVSVGQSGDVPIPPSIREVTGINAGSVVSIEARDGAIVIRPISIDAEAYTAERKAEFLLSNAVDAADYAAACEEVRALGLYPDQIPHHRPAGV